MQQLIHSVMLATDEQAMRPNYAETSMSIREAMVAEAKRLGPRASRPLAILWGGFNVQTVDCFEVPKAGVLRIEFVSSRRGMKQGIDTELDRGWIRLPKGEAVAHLRTWNGPGLPHFVEYPFEAPDMRIWVSNIYEQQRGAVYVTERWTGNAGMIVSVLDNGTRLYRCSCGDLAAPDFDSLVVRLSVAKVGCQ